MLFFGVGFLVFFSLLLLFLSPNLICFSRIVCVAVRQCAVVSWGQHLLSVPISYGVAKDQRGVLSRREQMALDGSKGGADSMLERILP